jgi:hypothetical protein
MGRTDLMKAKAEQEEAAKKWYKKEQKRLRSKEEGFLIKLTRFISRCKRSVGYRRHQGNRECARRMRQLQSGFIKQ